MKKDYTFSEVERIAEQTKNCPFCIEGKPLEMLNLNKIPTIKFISSQYTKRGDNNMVTMTDFFDSLTAKIGLPPEFNKEVFPQLYARLLNMGISLGVPNEVIRKLAINFPIGLAAVIGNEFFMPNGRLKDEIRAFATNFLMSAIPNVDVEKYRRDLEEIGRMFRFGNPLEVLKMAFQSPIEQIQAGIRDITRALGFGGAMPGQELGFRQIGYQAPGQIRGARQPQFPIPFGRQVATTGFSLPQTSPLMQPGLPQPIVSDTQFLSPGARAAGFRVIESLNR